MQYKSARIIQKSVFIDRFGYLQINLKGEDGKLLYTPSSLLVEDWFYLLNHNPPYTVFISENEHPVPFSSLVGVKRDINTISLPPKCSFCASLLHHSSTGFLCSNYHCRGRFISRFKFFVSTQGMNVSIFQSLDIDLFMEKASWFRSLDMFFDPMFSYQCRDILTSHEKLQLEKFLMFLLYSRTILSVENHFMFMFSLIKSLSIPGITESVIRKILKFCFDHAHDPLPTICEMILDPSYCSYMELSQEDAFHFMRESSHFYEEISKIGHCLESSHLEKRTLFIGN